MSNGAQSCSFSIFRIYVTISRTTIYSLHLKLDQQVLTCYMIMYASVVSNISCNVCIQNVSVCSSK